MDNNYFIIKIINWSHLREIEEDSPTPLQTCGPITKACGRATEKHIKRIIEFFLTEKTQDIEQLAPLIKEFWELKLYFPITFVVSFVLFVVVNLRYCIVAQKKFMSLEAKYITIQERTDKIFIKSSKTKINQSQED